MRFGCIKRAGGGRVWEGHGSLDRLDMQPSCINGGLSAPPEMYASAMCINHRNWIWKRSLDNG